MSCNARAWDANKLQFNIKARETLKKTMKIINTHSITNSNNLFVNHVMCGVAIYKNIINTVSDEINIMVK